MSRYPLLMLWFAVVGCIEENPREAAEVAPTTTTTTTSTLTDIPDVTEPDTSLDDIDEPDGMPCVGCTIEGRCFAFGDLDPDNACRRCDAAALDRFTVVPDETECVAPSDCSTGGQCHAGVCDAVIDSDACFIEGACRTRGADPSDACRICTPEVSQTQWQRNDCGDGLACTLDVCEEGQCINQIGAGSCVIDGTCVAEGTREPGKPCMACIPAEDTEDWSVAEGFACDDGDACTEDTCGADAQCHGEVLKKGPDGNNNLPSATHLGSDIVTFPAGEVDANINPHVDLDWFTWRQPLLKDGLPLRPRARLETSGAGALSLCMWATCGANPQSAVKPTVVCGAGQTEASESTRAGCCVVGDEDVDLTITATCPVSGDLVQPGVVWARVSLPGNGEVSGTRCMDYKLVWGADATLDD